MHVRDHFNKIKTDGVHCITTSIFQSADEMDEPLLLCRLSATGFMCSEIKATVL